MKTSIVVLTVTAGMLGIGSCEGQSVSGGDGAHTVGGRSVEQVFEDSGAAALARAACQGDVAAINRALREGANVDARGYQGVTPLIWAQSCQNLTGMEALLDAGADPNLMTEGRGSFSAVTVAAEMETGVLRLLLDHGGDANAAYGEGPSTALTKAFERGVHEQQWENFYALLEEGSDINRVHGGSTIAEFAAALNQYDKVAELLERGYNTRLNRLALRVQNVQLEILPRNQREWVVRVRDMLMARGVRFPVTPENAGYAAEGQ